MRLRNVPGAREKIEQSKYVIENPKQYRGNFSKLFENNNNPIYVEIGTGKGRFIIENAKRYPEINFIGIEKFDSVLVRALEKIDEEIPNLKFIRMDAKEIENVFECEVEKVYLNFSDPWPKDRHAKRRLTSPEFLNRYDNIFKDKKEIEMKTDNRHLFEYSVQSLTDYQYKIINISLDLHNDNFVSNIQTEYEDKFSQKGQVIYFIHVRK